MSNIKLEYADVKSKFGSLVKVIGRPNIHTIRALENECIRKAITIPNPECPNMGYAGIFMNRTEYAMSEPQPYIDPANPGATPNYNRVDEAGNPINLTENDRAIIKAQYESDVLKWSNHEVVHRVIKDALDTTIDHQFKPAVAIGQHGFGNSSVREIFADLYARYGKTTLNDQKDIHTNLYKPWNPSVPIETFMLNIENQQVFGTKAGKPFHVYQLIDAALLVIKQTGVFKDELKEWNTAHPDSSVVHWHVFKRFWIEKYAEWENNKASMGDAGYHGASNVTDDDDTNSLASLTEAFTTLQSQRTQHEATLQNLMSTVETMRTQLANQAMMLQQPPPPMFFPPAPYQYQAPLMQQAPPPAPIYNQPPQNFPPPPPTIYTNPTMASNVTGTSMPMPPPPAPTQQTAYQQGGTYNQSNRGRGRGGANRGGGKNSNTGRGRQSNPQHPIKRYNNWFYCASCGFDTPHESANCTNPKNWHVPFLTRDMKIADMNRPAEQQQYRSASHAGHHKRFLPSQAAANGYPQYQRDS